MAISFIVSVWLGRELQDSQGAAQRLQGVTPTEALTPRGAGGAPQRLPVSGGSLSCYRVSLWKKSSPSPAQPGPSQPARLVRWSPMLTSFNCSSRKWFSGKPQRWGLHALSPGPAHPRGPAAGLLPAHGTWGLLPCSLEALARVLHLRALGDLALPSSSSGKMGPLLQSSQRAAPVEAQTGGCAGLPCRSTRWLTGASYLWGNHSNKSGSSEPRADGQEGAKLKRRCWLDHEAEDG